MRGRSFPFDQTKSLDPAEVLAVAHDQCRVAGDRLRRDHAVERKPCPEVVPGYSDRILPEDDDAAKELKKRTLTNLYNARPQWLATAACRARYGGGGRL